MTKRLLIFYLLVFLSQLSHAQLVCAFTASDTVGSEPLVVNFTDNSSGNATSWYWNFGNGDTSTEKNPQEIFNDSGTFTVVHVIMGGGIYDTSSATIKVVAGGNPLFSVSSVFSFCPPFPIQFTQFTYDTTYSFWNFGDGDTSTGVNPSHIYLYPGIYSVTHRVINKYGYTADTTLVDLVEIKGPIVTNLLDTPTTGCLPLTVHCSAQFYSVAAFEFVPEPGVELNNEIPDTFTYTTPGIYQATITATDSFGCTVPYLFGRDTVGPIALQLVDSPNYGCLPLTVHFSAQTVNLVTSVFTPALGVSLNALPDSFTYQLQGTDTPAFTITDSRGCTAKYFFSEIFADSCVINGILPANTPAISILPNPAANFVKINASGIFNLNVFNTSGDICLKKERLALPAMININQFPPGLYILALYNTNTDESTAYKLMVDR